MRNKPFHEIDFGQSAEMKSENDLFTLLTLSLREKNFLKMDSSKTTADAKHKF